MGAVAGLLALLMLRQQSPAVVGREVSGALTNPTRPASSAPVHPAFSLAETPPPTAGAQLNTAPAPAPEEQAADLRIERTFRDIRNEKREDMWAQATEAMIRRTFGEGCKEEQCSLREARCGSTRCLIVGEAINDSALRLATRPFRKNPDLPQGTIRTTRVRSGEVPFRMVLVRQGFTLDGTTTTP
jgi:hypothetical protein